MSDSDYAAALRILRHGAMVCLCLVYTQLAIASDRGLPLRLCEFPNARTYCHKLHRSVLPGKLLLPCPTASVFAPDRVAPQFRCCCGGPGGVGPTKNAEKKGGGVGADRLALLLSSSPPLPPSLCSLPPGSLASFVSTPLRSARHLPPPCPDSLPHLMPKRVGPARRSSCASTVGPDAGDADTA